MNEGSFSDVIHPEWGGNIPNLKNHETQTTISPQYSFCVQNESAMEAQKLHNPELNMLHATIHATNRLDAAALFGTLQYVQQRCEAIVCKVSGEDIPALYEATEKHGEETCW